MWRVCLAVAAGCSFTRGATQGDAAGAGSDTGTNPDAPSDARVRMDAALDAPPPPIAFVQVKDLFVNMSASGQVTLSQPNVAHDLGIVVVGWINTHSVQTITDTDGNTYVHAGTGTVDLNGMHQETYYCCDLQAGTGNQLTVTFDGSLQGDIRFVEYSGLRAVNCLDQLGSNTGSTTALDSGNVTSTFPRELLFASNTTIKTVTTGDSNFNHRTITAFGDIVEDVTASAIGTFHAGATQNQTGDWVMQILTFYGQ